MKKISSKSITTNVCIIDWEAFHIAHNTQEKAFNEIMKMLKDQNLPGIRKEKGRNKGSNHTPEIDQDKSGPV